MTKRAYPTTLITLFFIGSTTIAYAKEIPLRHHFSPQLDDIQAPDAWKIEEGKKKIIVAVVDTGIDPSTRLLKPNLWQDRMDKHPEIYGFDFVNDRINGMDQHGHGTHVSGIVGAKSDTERGISGVTHDISIMPVKYYSETKSGSENLTATIRAFNFAIDHGARIINYSAGGTASSELERQAIIRAGKKGVLVIVAAGNEHSNIDLNENAYFPASYHLPNMISVASTDLNDELLPSSNWGKRMVDVTAPGKDILSTLPNGQIGLLTGTSQATGFVSGTAALLWSKNPALTAEQVKQTILSSVDRLPQLKDRVATGGRVNVYKALQQLH